MQPFICTILDRKEPRSPSEQAKTEDFYELWTPDGCKLAFNPRVGGPNTSSCPIHTDARHINVWEALLFRRTYTESPVPVASIIPPGAVPYTIQTHTGSYLQSIPERSSISKSQPVYKTASLGEDENCYVTFVNLPRTLGETVVNRILYGETNRQQHKKKQRRFFRFPFGWRKKNIA